MSKERARKLIQEAQLRKERQAKVAFEDLCFAGQLEFVQDTSSHILACCSRRAGKSYGIAIKMLETMFKHPKCKILYATMSRSMGKDILWPALEELNDKLDLGLKFNQATGDVTAPNGSMILLRGIGSKREADKLRGPAYIAGCIDEAQGMGWLLEYTIAEVIEPAQLTYGDDAWLAVTGTPNANCSGPFFDMVHGLNRDGGKDTQVYNVHHWTFLQNEAIPNRDAALQKIMERRGWTEDTPKFRREYLGEWVKDSDGSAFSLKRARNIVHSVPMDQATDWSYVLGIDLGINDPCAFVVLTYSRQLGECYVVESFEQHVENISEAAVSVERLMSAYDLDMIVADSGGIGKAFVAEWATVYGIPVHAANKTGKAGKVALLNASLQAGTLKFLEKDNHDLINQLEILPWDEGKLEMGKHVYQNGFADHLADALQYGFTECHHYLHKFQRDVDMSDRARYQREEERMMRQAEREYHAKHNPSPSSAFRRYIKGLWG